MSTCQALSHAYSQRINAPQDLQVPWAHREIQAHPMLHNSGLLEMRQSAAAWLHASSRRSVRSNPSYSGLWLFEPSDEGSKQRSWSCLLVGLPPNLCILPGPPKYIFKTTLPFIKHKGIWALEVQRRPSSSWSGYRVQKANIRQP